MKLHALAQRLAHYLLSQWGQEKKWFVTFSAPPELCSELLIDEKLGETYDPVSHCLSFNYSQEPTFYLFQLMEKSLSLSHSLDCVHVKCCLLSLLLVYFSLTLYFPTLETTFWSFLIVQVLSLTYPSLPFVTYPSLPFWHSIPFVTVLNPETPVASLTFRSNHLCSLALLLQQVPVHGTLWAWGT